MSFGGVSLYGLWAANGAAPGPLALFAHDADRGIDDKIAGGCLPQSVPSLPGAT